jgi:hypothetical protein
MEPLRLPARGLVLTPTPLARQPVSWVVLLHGFPQNCACWTWVLATLAAARSRYPCPGPRRARCRPRWPGTERPGGSACGPPGAGADAECVGSGHPALVAARGHHDRALGDRRPPVRGPCRRRPDDPIQVSDSRLVQRVAGHRPATRADPASRSSGHRPDRQPRAHRLHQADAEVPGPGHRPGRVPDLGIRSVRGRDGGRNQAGSEPGGDPPKPPGAASPRTEHGSRREETRRRARRETGAAVPGFADRTLFPGGCSVLSS